jgi:hypothetical protein
MFVSKATAPHPDSTETTETDTPDAQAPGGFCVWVAHTRMVPRSPCKIAAISPRFAPGVSVMRSIKPRTCACQNAVSGKIWKDNLAENRTGHAPRRRAAQPNDVTQFARLIFAVPLETWLVMHEDLRASPRVRRLFDHLAQGIRAYLSTSR